MLKNNLKLVEHVEQIFDETSVDELAAAFAFDEHEETVHAPQLYGRIRDYVDLEEIETQIPYGEYERVVEHVAAVERQKDLTNHVHLRAMVLPVGVKQFQVLDLIIHVRRNTNTHTHTNRVKEKFLFIFKYKI